MAEDRRLCLEPALFENVTRFYGVLSSVNIVADQRVL